MKSDLYKGIVIFSAIITAIALLIYFVIKADERDVARATAKTKNQCEAMFALANDLPDTLKVVKIDNACLRYIR